MPRYRLTKSAKLRRPAEFARVYAVRVKAGDDCLLVFGAPRSVGGRTRAGLSVSKKHGGAVARNRIKRLLREAYRLETHRLPPGLDLILIPRIGRNANLNEFRESLLRCARRIQKRLDTDHRPPG